MSETSIINKAFSDVIVGKFTKKELEIYELIAQGFSNRTIAEKLCLSLSTINTHTNHIFQKLNIKDRSDSSLRVKASLFWLKHKENIINFSIYQRNT